MADFPAPRRAGLMLPATLNPYDGQSTLGQSKLIARTTGASAVYQAANRAWFIPLEVDRPTPIRRLWWHNGATVSGNIDVGVFRGTERLVSVGGVAQAGVSTVQDAAVAETWVYPDEEIRLAVAMDNVTGTLFRYTTSYILGECLSPRHRFMDSAYPLPATATFAEPGTSYWPVIGAGTRAEAL